MKYQAPPGTDPGSPYIDGNRSAGLKGSIVPAKAIEHPMRELEHLIAFAGLTPAQTDLEQVRKAIEALISAATGGGDTSQFLLVSQARSRLPIYPEIDTADGRMIVTSPGAGSVLVPPTVSIMHRGIYPLSTSDYDEVDRTFATSASKTYHLRWNPTDGFELKDLADSGYNPTVAAESSVIFDSTYDDMIVARVVTNVGNVATITNLANRHRLGLQIEKTTFETWVGGGAAPTPVVDRTVNWARQPVCRWQAWSTGGATSFHVDPVANMQFAATRYICQPRVIGIYSSNDAAQQGGIDGTFRIVLEA